VDEVEDDDDEPKLLEPQEEDENDGWWYEGSLVHQNKNSQWCHLVEGKTG
jgi:hypothetical protein